MTVLVDTAVWKWRGHQWAHLVSDDSFDELHEFARQIGMRRLGFQGDHYDVTEIDRQRALDLGAAAVDSRELMRRLRMAGLRRRDDKPSWQRLGFAPSGRALDLGARLAPFGDAGQVLRTALPHVRTLDRASRSSAYVDDDHLVVLFDWHGSEVEVEVELEGVDLIWAGEPRTDGERSLELFVERRR